MTPSEIADLEFKLKSAQFQIEACDEQIERQAATIRKQAEALKIATEALEPFGKAGGLFDTGKYQQRAAAIYSPAAGEEFYLNSGHLLKARDALARIKEV